MILTYILLCLFHNYTVTSVGMLVKWGHYSLWIKVSKSSFHAGIICLFVLLFFVPLKTRYSSETFFSNAALFPWLLWLMVGKVYHPHPAGSMFQYTSPGHLGPKNGRHGVKTVTGSYLFSCKPLSLRSCSASFNSKLPLQNQNDWQLAAWDTLVWLNKCVYLYNTIKYFGTGINCHKIGSATR